MKVKKKLLALAVVTSIILVFIIFGFRNDEAVKIKSGKDITFFVTSDIHYLAEGLTDNGEVFQKFIDSGDGKLLNYIHEIMDAFTYDIKKKKPDVLIISGDLTSNGERESHIELSNRLKQIEKTGTSVFVIPGNHDILNPYARGFKGDKQYVVGYIDHADFSKIYEDYGYKEAISRDEATLSYLAAPSEDVWLLMLDTAQYKNNVVFGFPQSDGRVAPETMEWIRQCGALAKANGAKLIAVMHHNLIDHSEVVREGYTINNSKEVVKLFEENNIELALSGHIHLQDIKSNKNVTNTIFDIATGCISVYPQKYGVLKYLPKTGMDYRTYSVDVEGWSKYSGIVDEKLNDYTAYSRSLYGERLYNRVVSRLAITDAYTTEELKLMGEVYKELQLRYFEGHKEVCSEEIKRSPGLKLWLSAEQNYTQRNILRLINADGEENNKLFITNGNILK